jgi:hypothetical protein
MLDRFIRWEIRQAAKIMPKGTRPWTEREWVWRLRGLTVFGALLGLALAATVADAVWH